jgi:hypothetical protein
MTAPIFETNLDKNKVEISTNSDISTLTEMVTF